ncbi:phosphotransferase [Algoriphagus confluentis]
MLELSEKSSLEEIQKLSFWKQGEKVAQISIAGPGNMNLVLRVKTDQRSVILKQSKPFVKKFPQIPAPIDRIQVEYQFYQILNQSQTMREFVPLILGFDPENHLLLTEDLGVGKDFTEIYSGKKKLRLEEVGQLVRFLNTLHELSVTDFPDNLPMRRLNHEHIFNFPFREENGFDLDTIQPGLQALSMKIKQDEVLKEKVAELGERYLSSGKTLLHGDFYPGSWLQVDSAIKIIDPEFGFLGDREFDLGVFLAHMDLGLQGEEILSRIVDQYAHPLDHHLLNQCRGVEILRRLIGIAQLPLQLNLEQKEELLKFAKHLILN